MKTENNLSLFLPMSTFNTYRIVTAFDLKKKGSWKKSYERRGYESVDDRSLSYVISQKLTGKSFWAAMG